MHFGRAGCKNCLVEVEMDYLEELDLFAIRHQIGRLEVRRGVEEIESLRDKFRARKNNL